MDITRHPEDCGPCPDCAEALKDYDRVATSMAADRERLDVEAYWRTVHVVKA